ncbi:redoxin domain-containing protein [uncultured Gimesia sp.]|uniref:redoxin domain-containing protein n=1 Tax=uncultured Gimesia sp. TaxID=1678688 RepID=UPI0030DBCF19|tara:strand:- start:47582 stop:49972 length:2391 start_codon:yes stop_codon:yes gene_type:complete
MLKLFLPASLRKTCSSLMTVTALLFLSNTIVWSADKAAASDAKKETSKAEEILAGHSYHGEVFNEGPRRAAYLMGNTGDVHFDVTVKNPEAQKFLDQGLGQLHGFWYLEAERSFRHAANLDPDCAMAFWGAAMCNLKNSKRAKGFIEQANKRIDKASPREKQYIKALEAYINADKKKSKERNDAYTKAMENLILDFPDDLEAKAFLAVHLYNTRSSSTSYIAAEALLQDIFAKNPLHPAHHYRIHLWDHRKPEMALTSAAKCGQSSPGIAHMWHMPGHIYSRLNRYQDAVWQQEASARVDHAHMMRDVVMPDQIHNYAHNNEWLIRNLIFIGRVHDAVALAKNMIELPQHPKYNTFKKRGSAKYGRMRLLQVLRTYELWDELIALSQTPYLEPTDVEDEQVNRLRYLGLAYYAKGNTKDGDAQLAKLQKRLDKLQAEKKQAEQAAALKLRESSPVVAQKPGASKTEKVTKGTQAAIEKAGKSFAAKIKKLERPINALKGHQAIAAGDFKSGHKLLKKAGGADEVYLISVLWKSGEAEKAEKALRKLIGSHKNEVQPQATLVELLWQADKKEPAKKEFEKLQELSATIDLDVPLFVRLAPIAKELSFETDWRIEAVAASDVGDRPDLKTLGPFRWKPSPAPTWQLKDATGKQRSAKEFRGKPHVLIFYLGFSCLHCAEQLQAFAPMVHEFEKAGIPLMAISTDNQEGLKTSIKNYDKGDLPIPLFSNDKLDVFKTFHVFDDFEKQPLHGTFIIDADGNVLWQDISYEPFMDPKFVLKEAKRLLPKKAKWTGMQLDIF